MRARKFLEDSKNNVNPFDQYKPEIPEGVFLMPGTKELDEFEEIGMQELCKLGVVLIAGGLGERLGYSGIKITLPVSIIEDEYSYLKYYASYITSMTDRAKHINPHLGFDFHIPFCIMVSDDTE